MRTDIDIAQSTPISPISQIAAKLQIPEEFVHPYGRYKTKIDHRFAPNRPPGKIILVTAISPTPAGEGKTTTTVGLGDALAKLGKNTMICLREPSLGPVFGVKGGAAGGGYAQIVPMEDINLHFTGDIHAITTANNLLAALLDNHIQQGNALNIDPRQVTWRRAMDMNDRQLRNILNGLGGKTNGTPREDGFDITAASEVMAVFCLSHSLESLKENLGNIVVGYSYEGKPITAAHLNAQGAMAALLKEAFDPNLVQTLEGTPALVHGGPFANIAHGCNTAVATTLAAKLGDYVVTEAGFGADLGAEKFINIKCRRMGLTPAAVVLVATVRALKHHGDLANLQRHIENITQVYGLPCVVAINRFPTDTDEEIAAIRQLCANLQVACELSEVHAKGGEGGIDLANAVLTAATAPSNFAFTYESDATLRAKIQAVAKRVYRATAVQFAPEAARTLRTLEKLNYAHLPICMAKTQYSFSDDPKKLGAPTDFTLTVRQVRLSAGAGFVVAITGDIMTMPGLPKTPAAEAIDLSNDGRISGLF